MSALFIIAGVISVVLGGLGAIGFLIAEIILPRISRAHAGRLYVFSGVLGAIITIVWVLTLIWVAC